MAEFPDVPEDFIIENGAPIDGCHDDIWDIRMDHLREDHPCRAMLRLVVPCIPGTRKGWGRMLRTATFWIVLAQCIVMTVILGVNGFDPSNSMLGPRSSVFLYYGAKYEPLMASQPWRFFTCLFLHVGLVHLLMNGMFLFRIAAMKEYNIGTLPFLFIFFSSGFMGTLLSCMVFKHSLTVGSSAAVMGILSAWMTEILLDWYHVAREQKTSLSLQFMGLFGVLLLWNAFSAVHTIDWASHLGGIAGGILSALVLFSKRARFVGITLYAACFVVLVFCLLSENGN